MKLYDVITSLCLCTPSSVQKVYYLLSGNHSIASFILPDRYEAVKVKKGIARGLKVQVHLRREHSFFFGTYEEDVQSVLHKQVREGMSAYNLGAHIGFFTLGLARLVGSRGQVISFEPNPDVCRRLSEHVSMNQLSGRVRVEECALTDFDGNAEFSASMSDTQGRFSDLPYVDPKSSIKVCCKRLDTYVAECGPVPDIVLMDVEHAEGRVLRGMSRLMEEVKPVIIMEVHGSESIREVWSEVKRHNYSLARIPNLIRVTLAEDVVTGHYLAAHRSRIAEIL